MRLDGIDVSVWQGLIDWTAVAETPVEVVIAKATEGSTFKDRTFASNYRGAVDAGIPYVGAYHFLSNEAAIAQIANLAGVVNDNITPAGTILPEGAFIAIDYESNGATGAPPPDLSVLLEILELAEQRWPGRVCWYTYTSLARRVIDRVPIGRPLWLADYTTGGANAVLELGAFLWQWDSSQYVLGIPGRVDANEITVRAQLEHLAKHDPEVDTVKPLHLISSGVEGEALFVRLDNGAVLHLGGGESGVEPYVGLPVVEELGRDAYHNLVRASGTLWRPADWPAQPAPEQPSFSFDLPLAGELRIRG